MSLIILPKFKSFNFKKRGFTLVELLVVISIIGVLSSTVFASLSSARAKARDARRMSDIKNIQTALELYKDEFNEYPRALPSGSYTEKFARSTQYSGNGTNNYAWYNLKQNLSSYITLPLDPTNSGNFYYIYDADSGDNYQSYGLSVNFESSSNSLKEQNDGGYFNSTSAATGRYEVGAQPAYCVLTYTAGSADGNWVTGSDSNNYPVCVGTPIP